MMKKEFSILIGIGLAAVFSLALVSNAQAAEGDLAEASSTPGNLYGGMISSYMVSFKTHEEVPNNVQIRIIFPAGFSVAGATATSTMEIAYGSTVASATTSSVSGQEITLTLAANSNPVISATSTVHISGIPDIQSPYAGGSFQLDVRTITTASGTVDSASTTAFSITPSSAAGAPDTLPPSSNITKPITALTISAGQRYVIEGMSWDTGGSRVKQVEVSLDDGVNWSPVVIKTIANIFNYWEYVWENPAEGEYTIKARATDTAGNIETAKPGVGVTVSAAVPPEVPEAPEVPAVPEKPISEMTAQELRVKVAELQQRVIVLLQQLIQILQQQIQELLT